MATPDWQDKFENQLIPLVCACHDRDKMTACMQAVVDGLFKRDDDTANKTAFMRLFQNYMQFAQDEEITRYAEEFLRMVMSVRIELAFRAQMLAQPQRLNKTASGLSSDIELLQEKLNSKAA